MYVIVISRARGMYEIYCTKVRGHEAAQGLSAIHQGVVTIMCPVLPPVMAIKYLSSELVV